MLDGHFEGRARTVLSSRGALNPLPDVQTIR